MRNYFFEACFAFLLLLEAQGVAQGGESAIQISGCDIE
jgi:hypothetical protein